MNHFRNLGNKLKSLSMLNMVSVASAQPFDKVVGLIKSLLAKLEKEAAEAADTHAFCEEEKVKNDEGIKKTTDKLDTLKARLDKAEAKKASLSDDVVQLTDEVAAIDKSDEEATKLRQDQHATFAKAEADFSEAADAVQDAIDALKDYYGGASLLQTKKGGAPPQLGGARSDSSNIIVGMMETMAQEFAQTVAKLQAEEREALEAYRQMTQDNKVAKTAKESEIAGSKREIASLDVAIGHHTEDKAMSEKELAAIKEYVESLKPTCYGRVVPYAERKAKREAELDGLKEALDILEESSPSLVQVQNKLRH
jgi:chromosome segregation ATPase